MDEFFIIIYISGCEIVQQCIQYTKLVILTECNDFILKWLDTYHVHEANHFTDTF